ECQKRFALLGTSQPGAMGRVEGPKTGAAPPSLEAALAPAPADNSRVLAIEARRRIPDLALDLCQRLSSSCQAVSLSGEPLQLAQVHALRRHQDLMKLCGVHPSLPLE